MNAKRSVLEETVMHRVKAIWTAMEKDMDCLKESIRGIQHSVQALFMNPEEVKVEKIRVGIDWRGRVNASEYLGREGRTQVFLRFRGPSGLPVYVYHVQQQWNDKGLEANETLTRMIGMGCPIKGPAVIVLAGKLGRPIDITDEQIADICERTNRHLLYLVAKLEGRNAFKRLTNTGGREETRYLHEIDAACISEVPT